MRDDQEKLPWIIVTLSRDPRDPGHPRPEPARERVPQSEPRLPGAADKVDGAVTRFPRRRGLRARSGRRLPGSCASESHSFPAPDLSDGGFPGAEWSGLVRIPVNRVSLSRLKAARRPGMSTRQRQIASAGLIVFASLLCLLGLTSGDLIRNEGLRARLALEAWTTGHWLVPTLHGEPYFAKPPGMTIAIGVCSLLAGQVTPISARLPSVIAGLVVVWLVYRTVADRLGKEAGLVAAAILPCSAMWLDRVPSAEIDLVQLAWVTGSLVCVLRALEGPGTARGDEKEQRETTGKTEEPLVSVPSWWWVAALACVAGGLFTKWTAPAFFYLTLIPFLAVHGRLPLLVKPPHLLAAGLVAMVALAWLTFAGHSAGWSVLIETIGREALLRLSPGHHPRPYPWDELILFPLSFLAANLPWSAFALVALSPSFTRIWDERTRRLLMLCQSWLWVNLLFWTLAPGHRPRHMLPAQPAISILAAMVWIAWLTGRLRWPIPRLRPVGVLLGLLAVWLAVKVVFVTTILPRRDEHRHPRAGGEMLGRLVPAGEILHLLRVKDDGLLYYYGRPSRRLHDVEEAPAGGWCLLTAAEWENWRGPRARAMRERAARRSRRPARSGAFERETLGEGCAPDEKNFIRRLLQAGHAKPTGRSGEGGCGAAKKSFVAKPLKNKDLRKTPGLRQVRKRARIG